jgi:hypothetical protein
MFRVFLHLLRCRYAILDSQFITLNDSGGRLFRSGDSLSCRAFTGWGDRGNVGLGFADDPGSVDLGFVCEKMIGH